MKLEVLGDKAQSSNIKIPVVDISDIAQNDSTQKTSVGNPDVSKYEVYNTLVNAIKSNFGDNINIEFSEKNGAICLMVYNRDGLKLSRVRVYQRENNPFDVALYRSDGTTLKMLFFNRQEELDSVLADSKQDLCLA